LKIGLDLIELIYTVTLQVWCLPFQNTAYKKINFKPWGYSKPRWFIGPSNPTKVNRCFL